MKKILFLLSILGISFSCKETQATKEGSLGTSAMESDLEGLRRSRSVERSKVDSLNRIIQKIDRILEQDDLKNERTTVAIQPLERTTFRHFIEIQGNVVTDEDIILKPETSGDLSLFVKEGQSVKEGMLLGELNDGGLSQNLASAESKMALAKIAFQKQSDLWKNRIGSEMEYLQAKTEYEVAKKGVEALREQKEKMFIKAPFSGFVDKIMIQGGEKVFSQSDVLRLISLKNMRIEADIAEVYLRSVKPGTNVEIFLPSLDKLIHAKVGFTSSFIDPKTRTFSIRIPVTNDDELIRSNVLAQVKIEDYVNPSAIQIDARYLYTDPQQRSYVFVVEGLAGDSAVAKKVYVEAGKRSESKVEVLKGLEKGDILVTDGSKGLLDGQGLKIAG